MSASFPETRGSIWAAIRGASRAEVEKILTVYREPILAWLRRCGLSVHDAEDVTQDALARLPRALEDADPAKGKLRALVKSVARHALLDHQRARGAAKRGGEATQVPLVEVAAEVEGDDFDAEWALNLVLQAMYRVLDGADSGKRRQVDALYRSAVKGEPLTEVASALGVSVANAKVLVHRGRKLLGEEVRKLVAGTASRDDLDAELALLGKLIPGGLEGEA